jgi:PleD family two-component response regulator
VLKVQHEGKTEITVEHRCTISIGVVVFINHEGGQDDILMWADAAMYQAKEAGRNLIRFYDLKDERSEREAGRLPLIYLNSSALH